MTEKRKIASCSLLNPIVKELTPYIPGEQPEGDGIIKLNTNENPYPPSPKAIDAMQRMVNADLRLYPDPKAKELKTALADFHDIKTDQIYVGNGSDEVLAMAFWAFFNRSVPLLIPDITYSFYPVYCRLFGQPWQEIPLTADLGLNPADYTSANGGILFPNPNAPTGLLLSLDQVQFVAERNPGSAVVVDEAYIDFGGESAIALLSRCKNLVVIRTFSKSRSLAGLRVGYAIAHPKLINALERVKNSFNSYPLDRLAISGAAASVNDRAYFEENRQKIIQTRERTANRLEKAGFHVIPSHGNFLLVAHILVSALKIKTELEKYNIWVRYLNEIRIENYVRVSIGTDREMDSCIEALEKIVAEQKHYISY